MSQRTAITAFRLLVLAGCVTPAGWLVWQWFFGDLGAVPGEAVVHFTGMTGLTLLLVTIAFSPAFRFTGWVGFMAARRQIGLWAFFWLVAHMLAWMGLDQYWDWPWIRREMIELPYIRYGVAALALLVPLALTSFRRVQKVIRYRAWHWLHRLIYVSAALGVTHFWILTRADYMIPLIFVAVLTGLIVFRIVDAMRHRR
ncbi:sulfite oxidase heme-binding subunit YedZ [Billgrantia montanilacus]|uniref:Protein-methionine-sulfoxide reductase heme-binding subunit MsrQ n=1 Tax=Billgrantia montanilacus TaxID=2282305 RepID=A0A368TQA7_9GAMM|nr:ferric reductase-like transmembrane domain-containing protein [Halomonas montanilacus]RCV86496.1 sulfoxide reductase heme-binding subunit YedZ [Halomonas montanilacus]